MKFTTIVYLCGLASLATTSPLDTINLYLSDRMGDGVHVADDPRGPCMGKCSEEEPRC